MTEGHRKRCNGTISSSFQIQYFHHHKKNDSDETLELTYVFAKGQPECNVMTCKSAITESLF